MHKWWHRDHNSVVLRNPFYLDFECNYRFLLKHKEMYNVAHDTSEESSPSGINPWRNFSISICLPLYHSVLRNYIINIIYLIWITFDQWKSYKNGLHWKVLRTPITKGVVQLQTQCFHPFKTGCEQVNIR